MGGPEAPASWEDCPGRWGAHGDTPLRQACVCPRVSPGSSLCLSPEHTERAGYPQQDAAGPGHPRC